MWIAKPISSLSEEETQLWSQIEIILPLSQTLSWARAIDAVSGRAYLVFSPDEKVGGIVFTGGLTEPSHRKFECINGPHLDWDNPDAAPRQFATFAMAVSKIDHGFQTLSIKPRWEKALTQRRLSLLPIPPFQSSQAATLVVPLSHSSEDQLRKFSPRLRRTLTSTWKNEVQTSIRELTPQTLREFVPSLQGFAKKNGFTVPPIQWFETLTQHSPFRKTSAHWLISAQTPGSIQEKSISQILICRHGTQAHYLFGYNVRSSSLRSSISLAAAAQWTAIKHCSSIGIENYDLNGYLIDAQPNHPYYGVCKFKEQFGGRIVQYDTPEFLIQ